MLNPDIYRDNLQLIDREVASTIPPALGIVMMNGVVLMPYGLKKLDAYHGVLVGFDWRSKTDVRIPLEDKALRGLSDGPVDEAVEEGMVGVSFRYYKAIPGTEIQEPGFRDLKVAVDSTCFSFGVLPGLEHEGERPTWYLGGLHVSHSAPDENGYLHVSEKQRKPLFKNFAFSRIINGPVDTPMNKYYRRAMGIRDQYPDPTSEE